MGADYVIVGILEDADAGAVFGIFFGGEADPAVGHFQGEEDLFADILGEGAAIESADEFAEDEPGGGDVVAGFFSGDPVGLELGGADFGDGGFPGVGGCVAGGAADAGGVG